jgi:hypothetical protein
MRMPPTLKKYHNPSIEPGELNNLNLWEERLPQLPAVTRIPLPPR